MTRLFYVDESKDGRHHFHAGILVVGPEVPIIETALDDLVNEAGWTGLIKDCGAELHGADFFQRQGQGPWGAASAVQRGGILEAALRLIPDHGVEVIAKGANLAQFNAKYPGTSPYRWEFSNLLERLNERLIRLDDYGLVIADEQHQYRKLLRYDVAQGKRFGTGGYRSQKLRRVVDTVHFVDSKLSRMVQLADLAAFVIRRRASIPKETDARLEALMARLHTLVFAGIPDPKGQFCTIRW